MPADDDAPLARPAERQPLLAAASTDGTAVPASATTFRRTLGTREAFSIVISVVIGSGIFTSPGAVDTNVPSPGAALVVWLVGGLLAWTGAATLAELGTAIPGEGGVQPYLQYIYGDVAGFLAAWTWLVVVMPSTLAILSLVFVDSAGVDSSGGIGRSSVVYKLLALGVLAATTLANAVSTRMSTRLTSVFVVAKFAAIAAVAAAAVAVVVLQLTGTAGDTPGGHDWRRGGWRGWFRPRPTHDPSSSSGAVIDWPALLDEPGAVWTLLGRGSGALYGALWAYSGWDKAVYVSAELARPAQQLPRALHTALPMIVVCFLVANAAYYVLLPWKEVSSTDSIAVTAFTRLLGPGFGLAAALLICVVVAGSLLGNSFVAGRMAVAAANKGWMPARFAVLGGLGAGSRRAPAVDTTSVSQDAVADAPVYALLLAASLATVYVWLGNFRALLTFNGLGEFTFFFLTVVGALVLRIREPNLPRPYAPVVAVPVAFAVVSGFIVVRGAVFAPTQALVLLALWSLGLVFYTVWVLPQRRTERTSPVLEGTANMPA